ncbi:hypothetical protein DEO72_LG1g2521 [Vigna unguiculata]|uniref:Uncharacterized protein n=1 Tax=Vigna unguiculata TaxID=3917 RepID=A0A4D6KQL4_VIGUN|nr:hypothetical protein DEO72_LG1g2521 [Vigna unguiculata]
MNGRRRVRGWGALGCSNLTASGPGMNGRRRVARDVTGRRFEEESTSLVAMVGRIPMETVTKVRKDPLEEITESNWPAKAGYDWVVADVHNQSSLFQCSRLLNSWLNCTPVIAKGVHRGIVSLERVSAIERVCHGQEGAAKKFFYMYMCHFSQLHVRLPLDDFTMGLPLVSQPSISKLDRFSQSFKHFKDGYFKVVVKEGDKSHFLNAYGSTKFPFSWMGSPSRYKDMGTDELSATDREVVEVLMKFTEKLPTEGLVRLHNLVHLIIDIEGHMAQAGKKNLTLFQTMRKEKAVKAKAIGKTEVPNLQESLVEVHVHGGTKRKAELPARPGKGEDVKKVRASLLGQGSLSGAKGPEAGLIELPKTAVRKDITINLQKIVINSIDNMESDHLVRTMVEFGSKALILSRRVGSLYRREVKEGNREKELDWAFLLLKSLKYLLK